MGCHEHETPQEAVETQNDFEESLPAGADACRRIVHYPAGDTDLIVEHNDRFVYPRDDAATKLAAGDRVELINPNFGG